MRVKYGWDSEYPNPEYWDSRTPLEIVVSHNGVCESDWLFEALIEKLRRDVEKQEKES